jgi:hypothetical protein
MSYRRYSSQLCRWLAPISILAFAGCVSPAQYDRVRGTYGEFIGQSGNSVQVCSWSPGRAGQMADGYCYGRKRTAELVGAMEPCRPSGAEEEASKVMYASGNAPKIYNYRCVSEEK